MTEIATMISTLGFPIVTAIILFFTVRYMFDKYTNDIAAMTAQHREEVSEFTSALNQNTLVLQKLIDKLDAIDEGDDGK